MSGCLLGVYACLRVVLTVCKSLQNGEKILQTLYLQKNIGKLDDAVVNATYFLQIRELVSGLSPEYKPMGIAVDAVISTTQAALVMLARLTSAFSKPANPEIGGGRTDSFTSIQNDISLFLGVIRKISS
jgi:hypothetical protein